MFLQTLVFTALAAVTAQDLLGFFYHCDKDFLHFFTQKNCRNTTPWDLVSYDHLGIAPPFSTSSKAIRSSRSSCASSFPIIFFNGTLEVIVYLRAISKNSGITISVFDEDDNLIVAVNYKRRNKNFITGWTEISVPITKYAHGYIQLSGQSLSSELVIIDSLRYTPGNSTNVIEQSIDKQSSPVALTTLVEDNNEDEAFIFQFDEIGSGCSEEDIEGSGCSIETESPDVDNPDQTELPPSSTDEPESAEVIDPEGPGFWNAFTISLVAVGGFFVVGSVGVGMYYLGKNAAMIQSPTLDLEVPEVPSEMIPRVRSVYSDRFSRFR